MPLLFRNVTDKFSKLFLRSVAGGTVEFRIVVQHVLVSERWRRTSLVQSVLAPFSSLFWLSSVSPLSST